MKLRNIKVIGFDLDQTLYAKSEEVDKTIQQYIYPHIQKHLSCSLEEAKKLFQQLYPGRSGTQTLIELGIPYADEILQEALEKADLQRFLEPDPILYEQLKILKQKYKLCLITGSHQNTAEDKLKMIQLPLDLFEHRIYGNLSKRTGVAFKEWMNRYPELKPENFLYVGDRYSTDVEPAKALGIQAVLVNSPDKIIQYDSTDEFIREIIWRMKNEFRKINRNSMG